MDFGYIICAAFGLALIGIPLWYLQQQTSLASKIEETAECPYCGRKDVRINTLKLTDRKNGKEINFLRKVYLSIVALFFSIGIVASAVNTAFSVFFGDYTIPDGAESPTAFTVLVFLAGVGLGIFSIKWLREYFTADKYYAAYVACKYCGRETTLPY